MSKKIALIGNANTGKSHSVNILLNVLQPGRYIPTLGCEVHVCRSNISQNTINIWDIAGNSNYNNGISAFCNMVDTFIYYPTTRNTQAGDKSDAEWYNFIQNTSPNANVITFNGNLQGIIDTL